MNTIKEYIKTLLKLAINNTPEVLKVIRNSKAVIANYRPDQKRIKGRFAYEGGNDLKVLYRKDNTPIDVTYYKNDIEEIPAFNIRDLRFIGRSPESVRKDEIKDAVLLGMEKIYATNKISNIEAAITNNGLKEMVGEIFKNKDEKEYSLLKKEIIAKVQNIFEESIPILKHNELKNPNLFDNQIIHRFALPIQIGQNEFLTMLTVKERADFEELNIDEFSIYDLNSKKQTSDRYSSLDDSTDGRSQMSIYSVDDLKQFVNTELHNKYGENRNINIDNDKWITIHPNGEDSKGRPLLLKDGENVYEAMQRQWGISSPGQLHLFSVSKYKSDKNYKKELDTKIAELNKNIETSKRDEAYKEAKKINDEWESSDMPVSEYSAKAKRFEERFGRSLAEVTRELRSKEASIKNYNKDQPRVPKGNPNGGQFVRQNGTNSPKPKIRDYKTYLNKHKSMGLVEKYPPDFMGITDDDIANFLGIKENKPAVFHTPVETVKIYRNNFKHIRHETDKSRLLGLGRAIRTLQEPNLIIQDGKENYYIKFFDKSSNNKIHLQVIKTTQNGGFYKTNFPMSINKFEKLEGQVIYDLSSKRGLTSIPTITKVKSNFNPDMKKNVHNNKEQDMALLNELKKLITKVENDKGEDMDKEKAKNEKVDKRKLIDEVAGIMKSAGADDELIRTAIGKMEKIAYDKSEAGTADNACEEVKNKITKSLTLNQEQLKKYSNLI